MADLRKIQEKYAMDKSLEQMGAFGPFSGKDIKGLNKAFSYSSKQKVPPVDKAVQRIENRKKENAYNVDWKKVKSAMTTILSSVKNAQGAWIGNDRIGLDLLTEIDKSARKLDDLASRRLKGSLTVR